MGCPAFCLCICGRSCWTRACWAGVGWYNGAVMETGSFSAEPAVLVLDDGRLALSRLDALLGRPLSVRLGESAWRRVEASRESVGRILSSGQPVYGINTGFGHLCRKRVDDADLGRLQENLIRSHAVGVGRDVPDAIVRWMLLLKTHALALGYSGVRRETLQLLVDMLCADLLPVVPEQGSLGASGDLAPLAHMVLPLIGEGRVRCEGKVMPVAEAFAKAGLKPVTLGPKEGLALINGTQFMSAFSAALCIRAMRAVKHADIIASMSLEALRGSAQPFDERLHALRPHRGAVETAGNMRRLLADSEILPSHADCGKVQDPYSLRCVPQVHGATRDALRHAWETCETEINSVTDNPVILDDATAISGGNFHGQPLALTLDYLAIAVAELAAISERRVYLLLSGHDGLPSLLMEDTGLNSGFMLPQYTAAALVSENKILASPASVDSIPTSLGQEDHVSMGATAATKAWRIMDNTETVLAIELMCAAQALDYRAPLKAGVGPRTAHDVLRGVIAHCESDRLFGQDIQASLRLLRSQAVVTRVEQSTGALE